MKRLNLFNVMMLAAGIVAGLAATSPASATLLGNSLATPQLSFDNGGQTGYDATTDLFSVNALPIAFRIIPGSVPVFVVPNLPEVGESFTIGITVDAAGNLVGGNAGDDLSIIGFIDLDGNGSLDVGGVLLTGEVTGFGYQENGATDLFDFTFSVTGGALAGAFGNVVGVSMQSERSSFAGNFENNFAGGAKGTLGVIPEPTTTLLLGSGLAGLAMAGRRRAA